MSRGNVGNRRGWHGAAWAVVALWLAAGTAEAQGAPPQAVAGKDATPSAAAASADRRCEYGVMLAMSGDAKGAESTFVSMLSASPGDARALNNLGNLRVVSGDLDVALAFYDRALDAQPKAAGVILNRATTLMLMGETDAAEAEAARGVKLAGGEVAAARLLGLSEARDRAQRGSDKPFVSPQEVRALLDAATMRVPGDSMKAGAAKDSTRTHSRARNPARTWRSAGPRAGDTDHVASVLYWMK